MGCDEQEGCAEKGKGDSQSAFSLDLRDDPSCDRGMLCFCEGQRDKMLNEFSNNDNMTQNLKLTWAEPYEISSDKHSQIQNTMWCPI